MVAFIALATLGKTEEPLKVRLQVVDEGKNVLKGLTINLYERNTLISTDSFSTIKTMLELSEESIYTVEVVKEGFVTKRISLYTDGHKKRRSNRPFDFTLVMVREGDYTDIELWDDFLEYPTALLKYDNAKGRITPIEAYYENSQKAFELHNHRRNITF